MSAEPLPPLQLRLPTSMPFLEAISWFDARPRDLSAADMLRRYEAGWKYHGVLGTLTGSEFEFVKALIEQLGSVIDLREI